MTRLSLGVAAAAALVSLSGEALGYGYPPPLGGESARWRITTSPSPTPGFTRNQLCLNISVFGTPTIEGAVAAFGYNGTPIAGIVGIGVDTLVFNTVTNVATAIAPMTPLNPSSTITGIFNDPAQYPAGAGLNWVGFSKVVLPFTAPALGANERYQYCFTLDVPNASQAAFQGRSACVASGVAVAETLQPVFNPAVTGYVGQPFGPLVKDLPAPGAAALMGLAGLTAVRRRRR
jgi:MYXO-CTERM domain-containing protein